MPALTATLSIDPGKIDRRVPYYVVEGCDYMLEPRQRYGPSEYEPAVACCPIGFVCKQAGNSQVSSFMQMKHYRETAQPLTATFLADFRMPRRPTNL
jgi:hypothetical protein